MPDIDITHPPITDLEKESFEDLRRYIVEDELLAQRTIALVRVNYQGVPRVVIAYVSRHADPEGVVDIIPLAMILNDEMFHDIIPLPDGILTTDDDTP